MGLALSLLTMAARVEGVLLDGRLFVPARPLARMLGANVNWGKGKVEFVLPNGRANAFELRPCPERPSALLTKRGLLIWSRLLSRALNCQLKGCPPHVRIEGWGRDVELGWRRPIRVRFAGDVIFGRFVNRLSKRHGPRHIFSSVASLLRNADLTVVNFEGCISRRGERQSWKKFTFRAPPQVAKALKWAGVDIVNLANNHALDYASIALLDTFTHLREAGIKWVGAGRDVEEASSPLVVNVKGLRLAFLGFTEVIPKGFLAGPSKPGVAGARQVLRRLKSLPPVEAVVVLAHWGEERTHKVSREQRKWAEAFSRLGADLIVGHHPHVLQGLEVVGTTGVAYSLGNFVHAHPAKQCRQSLVLEAELSPFGPLRFKALPVWIEGGRPKPADKKRSKEILDLLRRLSPGMHGETFWVAKPFTLEG